MTTVEVLSILTEPKNKMHILNCCKSEIENLHSIATSVKSISFDKERVSGVNSDNNAHYVSVIEKILDKEGQMQEQLNLYMAAYNKTEQLIGNISSEVLRAVLRNRYLLFLSYEEIAQNMHYSVRHIRRLHGKAIEILVADLQYVVEGVSE